MNMFKPTDAADPAAYIAALSSPRRDEIERLDALIRVNAPTLGPAFLQSGMLAYGPFHYAYDSGRKGDWFLIGLASRQAYISVYVMAAGDGGYLAKSYRHRLPKADIGRSCVRIKRLSDVDLDVLAELIRRAVEAGPPAEITR
jgi:Domain of unknown function (DU1801)